MNCKFLKLCLAIICCFSLAFSSALTAQCTIDIKDFPPIDGKDCAYLLVLSDSGLNGWDGASLDVAIAEGQSINYKLAVADGECLFVPLYVNDGETIDLAYWNGAFETEHGLTLYNALGEIAQDEDGVAVDYTGNVASALRVKADCPLNSCKDATEGFSVSITMGDFPEEQSWEIYDGTNDVSVQGSHIIGTNANIYNGLAPGFQVSYPVTLDLCNTYTFVAFDGFNDGWDSGLFEIFTANLSYGTEITDTSSPFFGQSLVLSGTGILDETRLEFTLPCVGACADVSVTSAVNCEVVDPTLTVSAPEVCYPECGHALGCDVEVQQFILPFGNAASAVAGIAFPYTGTGSSMSTVFTGTFPAGQHGLVTQYTYCDGVITKCTSNLVITGAGNPTLTCNDNVIISLNVPSTAAGSTTLGECITMITPDMVLENTGLCEGDYVVTIKDANGNPVVVTGANGLPLDNAGNEILTGSTALPAHNFISPNELMQTLEYTVTHLGTNNSCWGTITVEDKVAPVIACTDYALNCTHPEALNEDYAHTETYFAEELPANIAGGNGGIPSNTFIPVNVGCNAYGEVLQAASLEVIVDHSDLTDLSIILHAPTATGLAPIVLATNNMVLDTNAFDLTAAIAGATCSDLSSATPQLYTLETSGAATPSTVGMTWYVQVIDNNNGFLQPAGGGGEVTSATLSLTCGFPTPGLAYDCSLESVELINEAIVETACDQSDWNGAQIVRTWQATDKYGNSSVCTQTVSLKAPTMNQIVKPNNVTLECTGQTAAELTLAETGTPTFGCFDLTEEVHGLCDISYTYEDNVINTCGQAYKVIRSWTIISWCSGVTNTIEQIIKVEDTTGPAVQQANITIGTNPYTCDASVSLSALDITDNCSGVGSIAASFQFEGNLVIVDLTNGGTLTGLPLGTTEVEITANDACLNTTVETITITVEDTTIPVAICDDELHISLGGDGTARLNADDIDEGSYDNCSDITLEVRRTDGCIGVSEWSTYVPFECCDVDETVTVELRVTDAAGNSNVCWKSVLVEDVLAPIISCPADKTLNCNDLAVQDPFAEGSAIDNCNATVTYVDGGELDQCKAGTLTRTFTATDGSAKSIDATCTQTVTVLHVSDFIVQFPADVVLTSCELVETGAPTVTNDDCELIAISSEDQIFDIVADACYKIERTWTIINWCAYDQGADNTALGTPQPLPRTYTDDDGYFTYVQTIKVLDEVAPIIDCKGDETFCDLTDGCEGEATLTITATDACSDVAALEYTYQIDANNDGSYDLFGAGNDASGVYPYGTHAIKWIVEDGCGNSSVCEYLFTIEDCKNPTPVCLNGISIPNMETSGCVEVWASDLLEYAFDNCSEDATVEASARIRREGATTAPASVITLCCDDLGTVSVEIWVTDEAGNSDYCTTYIILQDNNSTCDQSFAKATLSGNVHTKDGDDVEGVMVSVSNTNMSDALATDVAGNYTFTELEREDSYTVGATKDVDPLNGVSTYDLVLISQHILGVNSFNNPYTMIAADVNNDGNVTTFDIVQLRQLILYVITDFPANTSWRFVDASYSFPNATNPWMETFPEAVEFDLTNEDVLNADLMAIKIGDVNGDATPNSLVSTDDRNNEATLLFSIDEQTFATNETVSIDFRASDFDAINGYQFTFNFDADVLAFEGVEAGELNVSEANFGLNFANEGVLTTSWHGIDSNIKDNAVLFTLTFNSAQAGSVSEAISINSRYTNAEAYTASDLMDVALVFNTEAGLVGNNGSFELFQNTPNPFGHSTLIGFNLPTATTATLVVYDVQGRVLKFVANDFAKGYNQISLDKSELNATGILYYELSTPTDTDTKKMIILE